MRASWTIVRKDLLSEGRRKDLLATMLVFSLLVVLIFNFALELHVRYRHEAAAGVLWVTFAFAGTLGLSRSMSAEVDRDQLDGLLLAPVDRSAIYVAKAFGNLLFMLLVEAIVLPIFAVLYNVDLASPALWGLLVVGSAGYAAVGTLLAAMAARARTRDVLLPVLLFPLVLPLLVAAVRATALVLAADAVTSAWPALQVMVVYDVVFVAVGLLAFEFVIAE